MGLLDSGPQDYSTSPSAGESDNQVYWVLLPLFRVAEVPGKRKSQLGALIGTRLPPFPGTQ